MRISSNFKDYYDSGQIMGQDQSLIYVRYQKTVQKSIPSLGHYNSDTRYNRGDELVVNSQTIGFCGKLYPSFKVTICQNNKPPTSHRCYTIEDIDKVAATLGDKGLKLYNAKSSKFGRYLRGGYNTDGKRINITTYIERFNEKAQKCADYIDEVFTSEKSPIFVVEEITLPHGYVTGYNIHYNAMLRPYEFIRVFDPTQAFQEISMFLGNMAFPNKPIPELSNADKIVSKGFDKFSFRKPKQGA